MCYHGKELFTSLSSHKLTSPRWVDLKTIFEVIRRLFLLNHLLGTISTVQPFKQLGLAKSELGKQLASGRSAVKLTKMKRKQLITAATLNGEWWVSLTKNAKIIGRIPGVQGVLIDYQSGLLRVPETRQNLFKAHVPDGSKSINHCSGCDGWWVIFHKISTLGRFFLIFERKRAREAEKPGWLRKEPQLTLAEISPWGKWQRSRCAWGKPVTIPLDASGILNTWTLWHLDLLMDRNKRLRHLDPLINFPADSVSITPVHHLTFVSLNTLKIYTCHHPSQLSCATLQTIQLVAPSHLLQFILVSFHTLVDWYIYLNRIAEKQAHAYQGHVSVCACVSAFLYERERGVHKFVWTVLYMTLFVCFVAPHALPPLLYKQRPLSQSC